MRYPKGLAKRADEILTARRQSAQERHRRVMAALDEQHPEIRAVGRELALLYAQRARLQLDPGQDTGEVETAIHEAQARREAAMAAAGLTEADLEPAYTCPRCGDRGVAEGGQMCECRQVILNQLVYYIEVYNNVEYAEPVEYGHRTRGGRGFVPGKHMMELSLEELNQALPGFLREWLSDFISTHDL